MTQPSGADPTSANSSSSDGATLAAGNIETSSGLTAITDRAKRVWNYCFPRARAVYNWVWRLPEWLLVSLFLLVAIYVGYHTFTRSIGGQFWMDEAITVGIAGHSFSAIPGIMKMDGSPPLFYMLLHIWISIFGNSEKETHALSVLIALIAIPAGYWGGRLAFNKRAAVFVAALFATNAFMIGYSTETRMYALMVLLGLLTSIGYVKAFAQRRRQFIPLFSLGQAAMLYTHSWGLFYGVASFLTLGVLWLFHDEEEHKNFIRDAVIAYAIVVVLYLPWLPTFIYQAMHTAAPWDAKPKLGLPVQIAKNIMGGYSVSIVGFGVAIYGLWRVFGRELRRSRETKSLVALLSIVVLTFVLAWFSSQITPAWVPRYFAPTVGPVLLMLGFGLSRARWIGVLALLFCCTTIMHPQIYSPANKSNMRQISGELGWRLEPGDLVVVGQPEQTPLAYYYLPAGLRFANTQAGLEQDPTFFNWENSLKKYKAADPAKILDPLLASLKVGQHLLFIQPLTEGNADWKQSWTEMIRLRSAQWGQILADDPQLKVVGWAPHYYAGACCVADSAVLYQKVAVSARHSNSTRRR